MTDAMLVAARQVLRDYDECSGAEPSLGVLHRSIEEKLRPAVLGTEARKQRILRALVLIASVPAVAFMVWFGWWW